MSEHYPFSVTFHGKDIVEVRGHMVAFLADNVTPGVQVEVEAKTPGAKSRKTTKKTKAKSSAKAVSTDTDSAVEPAQAPGMPLEGTASTNSGQSPDVTPEDHPNVSLAYNNALERLMEIYNGSSEGSYEVTLLLEEYRVASFREIPEDRGVELLDKANVIAAKLTTETAKVSA